VGFNTLLVGVLGSRDFWEAGVFAFPLERELLGVSGSSAPINTINMTDSHEVLQNHILVRKMGMVL
jgi:hypothetical protein